MMTPTEEDSTLDVVLQILTYNGSTLDIIINYVTIIVTLLPIVVHLTHLPAKTFPAHVRHAWLALTIILFITQLRVCIRMKRQEGGQGCVGVSLVWSALSGFFPVYYPSLSPHYEGPYLLLRTTIVSSLVVSLTAMVYYYITFPIITTIAHFSAVVLGAILGRGFRHYATGFLPNEEGGSSGAIGSDNSTTTTTATSKRSHLRGASDAVSGKVKPKSEKVH